MYHQSINNIFEADFADNNAYWHLTYKNRIITIESLETYLN